MHVFRENDPLPHELKSKKFRAKALITAVKMEKDFGVLTETGIIKGMAGDYIVRDRDKLRVMGRIKFEYMYEQVEEKCNAK